MKITDELLEKYKEKYKKEYEKFKYNQKLWIEWVKAKEKERQAREKINKITSKDRTRALIIFATEILKIMSEENFHRILEKINMVQRKCGKDFDYKPLIIEEFEKAREKNRT